MAIKVGFTGTSKGMSILQKQALKELLERYRPEEFHHGDCIGADEEAHRIAVGLNIPVVLHPPHSPHTRAFCKTGIKWKHIAKPYLVRNHEIVDAVDLLIAAPKRIEEELRSEIWATVRYAIKLGVSFVVLKRK